jgi:hypothetical protein
MMVRPTPNQVRAKPPTANPDAALPGRPAVRPTPPRAPAQAPPHERTVIAEIDAGVTSPDLKLPLDLRAALDSNPNLRATFDSNPDLRAIEGGPTNIVPRSQIADMLTPPPESEVTNPIALPIGAMAAHRHTAPMPVPDATKIGVVIERSGSAGPRSDAEGRRGESIDRPSPPRSGGFLPAATVMDPRPPMAPGEAATAEELAARVIPRRVEKYTPTSMVAADDPLAKLDAARARKVPDRVRLITPTAMHAEPAPAGGAPLDDDDDDRDDFHETRERPIDREALRKLPAAAAAVALGAQVLDPPSVLSGEQRAPLANPSADSPVQRPPAPARGGLVWLWMVLAVLAIAAAVATAMWYLAT